jgi:hypothetical protein
MSYQERALRDPHRADPASPRERVPELRQPKHQVEALPALTLGQWEKEHPPSTHRCYPQHTLSFALFLPLSHPEVP